MSSSLLARGLLIGLALSALAVPAAFADDPPPTTTETTTATTTTEAITTTETTTTETTTTTATATTEQAEAVPPDPWAETAETQALLRQAHHYRKIARRWRALMGKPRLYIGWPATTFASLLERRQWLLRAWRRKAAAARWRGFHSPHRRAWLCIHAFEGPWHDPYPPYYGGLQMDLTFQRQYGARLLRHKGTADNWSAVEQMWVAEHALRAGRGFYPWPVSGRRCGLI